MLNNIALMLLSTVEAERQLGWSLYKQSKLSINQLKKCLFKKGFEMLINNADLDNCLENVYTPLDSNVNARWFLRDLTEQYYKIYMYQGIWKKYQKYIKDYRARQQARK